MSRSWSRSRRELTLLAVALLAAACGGHGQPRVVGHYLVYSRNYDTVRGPSIVLARVDGSSVHTIAHGQDAVLSPDGRWVAFDVDAYRGRGTIYKLFVVSTRGSEPRALARTDSWPVWSPSSDRIVTYKGIALVSIDLHGRVTVLDARSGGGDFAFSPDGRWVAYIWAPETSDTSDLYLVRTSGGDRRFVTHDAGSPVWGKDWIAFVSRGGVWRIRPDGTGRHLVLPGPRQPNPYNIVGYFPVAWTPDEKTLLGQIATPHAWDVGIRIDVVTGRFSHVLGYPISLSRDGRFALVEGGRPTGGPNSSGRLPPEKIWALPFGHRGRPRVLARGVVCCPSWNR